MPRPAWTRPEHLVSRNIAGQATRRAYVRGTGIPAENVAIKFLAGTSIAALAGDYKRHPREIEDAIRYCAACWRKHLAVD